MFEERKEIDEKLHEIEDKERLIQDCENTNIAMQYIRNTAINNYESWRKEFIKRNVQLNTSEIMAVNKFVDFLKNKA